jgi:hypothetical protein
MRSLDDQAAVSIAREASAEHAACQELSELALDELRQAASLGARDDLGAKGLEVLADHAMEDRALHAPRLVAGGAHARRPSQRHPGEGPARKRAILRGTASRAQRQHATRRCARAREP